MPLAVWNIYLKAMLFFSPSHTLPEEENGLKM